MFWIKKKEKKERNREREETKTRKDQHWRRDKKGIFFFKLIKLLMRLKY